MTAYRLPQLSVATLAVLASACAGVFRVPQEPMVTRTLPVDFDQAPRTLDVYLHRGQILLLDDAEPRGELVLGLCAPDLELARQRIASIQVLLDGAGEHRELRVTHPEGSALDAVDVRCQLRLPQRTKVRVFTQKARVVLRGYRGDVEAQTESGPIDARAGGGVCTLATQSGTIRLEGRFERAELRSKTGAITVTVPAPPAERMLAEQVPTVRLDLASTSGPVRVDLDAASQMALRFTTRGGKLRTELPVRWVTNGKTPDGSHEYDGLVGHADRPSRVHAQVRTTTANLEVRPLGSGAAPMR